MLDQTFLRNKILEWRGDIDAPKYKWFVETGAGVGETTEWASYQFRNVVSIEFQDDYYLSVMQRCWGRKNVKMVHGDSADMLKHVLYSIAEPAIVFLDAHYDNGEADVVAPSGHTPVLKELQAAMETYRHNNHLVVVDDARLFGLDPAYPTLEYVETLAKSARYNFSVENDLILLIPEV